MAAQLRTPGAAFAVVPVTAVKTFGELGGVVPASADLLSNGQSRCDSRMSPAVAGAAVLLALGTRHKSKRCTKQNTTSRQFFSSTTQEPSPVFSPAAQVGVVAPLGFFDPLEICKEGDEAGFQKMRAYEIKHGRVAMMASLGLLAGHYAGLGPGSVSSVLDEGGLFSTFWICLVSGLEICVKDDLEEPGNFGNPLGLGTYTAEMRNKELNNGRMAMISVLGIVAAQLTTGQDAIQQLGLSAVPQAASHQSGSLCFTGRTQTATSLKSSRAISRSRLVAHAAAPQKAIPFLPEPEYWQWAQGVPGDSGFDPLNLWKGQDLGSFANQKLDMRDAEIKHCRLAMLAAVHWPMAELFHPMIAEAFGLPSKLAQSGLNPSLLNGSLNDDSLSSFLFLSVLAASITDLSKMEGTEPGDFGFDPLNIRSLEPPILPSIFNLGKGRWMAESEIAHGRLAMLAITAFAAQEKVSGVPIVLETPDIFGVN